MNLSNLSYDIMQKDITSRKNSTTYISTTDYDPIIVDDKANLTFIALGDCQVSNYMFARQYTFSKVLDDISNAEGVLDALVICGDIAESGLKCEYKMVSNLVNSCSDKYKNFLCMPGNHDIRLRRFKHQLLRFESFLLDTDKATVPVNKYWFSKDINGYKFIILGSDTTCFEAAHIRQKQLDWLDQEIASTQDTGKPVFVFNHHPLKFTNGLPDNWLGYGDWRGSVGNQSAYIRNIFNKYNNVIYITGHLHWGTNKYTIMKKDNFLALSVPTAGANNHGVFSSLCQGFVISAYDDRIEFRSRLFEDGKYTGTSVPCGFMTYDTKTFQLH